ncbi:uncharacterized protein LOC120711379 isoform X2 [Panicum virgatum]|uniref:uncharacterized protein LOC120711379 isoform X2 n=1 Tax=Panicum virgatum TaxID=38727 RepID=UPI0019D5C016|nr:uncharacterized protein LOC120711379 isoform X2 [Panicum virgatum]
MDSPRGLSKPADANCCTGRERKIVRAGTRRYGLVPRRSTTSTTKATTSATEGRMDGSSNNFAGNLQGSPGQMDNNHLMFNMHSPMNASDQVPMPQMTGAYQQAMFGGQFHGHFPASPQFVSQGYSGGNDQGQQQPSQEAIPGNANEDEVEEVPASQVPQPQGKKKGACHRGPGYEVEEDRVLVSGWLNISKDAATGTNQDKVAFYKRLRQYYIDNCATQNQRSLNSIQQRWSTIQTRVSRFCSILRLIERSNQSGKSYQDMVNEAIKEFQKTEPWHYGHCWEMLKDEPKWNEKVLEILQQNKGKSKQDASPTDTPTESAEEVSSLPARPEGRDSVKKRRATRFGDTSSSSVAVDMLKKMNDRGQEMDEIDAKHKAELMSLERAKFELQQKQWQAKLDMMFECSRLDREVTREQIKVQREGIEAQVKVQMQALEVERMKNDTQIMFTDATKLASGLREWVLKRQMEIMIRDGVHSNAGDSGNNDSRG